MLRSQLAINSITTRQPGLEEALAAYGAAGFPQVEFHLPLLKGWLADGHSIDDAKALLAENSLQAIGGFQSGLECFSSAESQQANRALLRENAQLIHDLGGGTLVVGTDGPPQPSVEALDVVAAELRSFAQSIEALDIVVGLEFNWGPLVKSLRSAQIVCEKADHPQVGILFDPAHYHTTVTKFEDLTPEAVGWIKHVHLNDMADKPGELSNCNADRVLMGDGILPLSALIGRLEEYGYEGSYSIELFNEGLWQLPAAETAALCYQSLLPYCED
jgi:sugar phosphate isomerase/epimerase